MFDVSWDKENNGILLKKAADGHEKVVPPRPVFHEELDLLGFDRFWTYPRSESPLLWAAGRKYYYCGVEVAQAKGGNIYEAPELILTDAGKTLKRLTPIPIDKVVKENLEALYIIENEALDFIEHTYKSFKRKVDFFAVAYSGGKDSEVVLDLVTRIIPPDELIVVFSDTTMEISYTYEAVERAKKKYEKKYPGLQFLTTKPPKPAIEFWDDFGPPSRIHRWCCTVTKTAPFTKLMKQLLFERTGENRQPKVVVFEGVRAQESNKRSNYKRASKGLKHINLTNIRPILQWSFAEIMLYLLLRDLPLNEGYKKGLNRVGCSICPFASDWSEYILSKIQKNLVDNFIDKIAKHALKIGIESRDDIDRYLYKGQWKKRAGGRGISNNGTGISFSLVNSNLNVRIKKPRENFYEWFKTIGEYFCKETSENNVFGELKAKNNSIFFEIKADVKKEKSFFTFKNVTKDIDILSKIKKVLLKTTYCVHCGACEAECPFGALMISKNDMRVQLSLCEHCGSCLDFDDKGCLVAKSVFSSMEGGANMKKRTGGMDRYSTFGMREEWVKNYFYEGNNWINSNNLGNKQFTAMLNWLDDAEVIKRKEKVFTSLGEVLQKIFLKDPLFVWQILWCNISNKSEIAKWYCNFLEWGNVYTKKELKEMALQNYPDLSKGTIGNPVDALVDTFAKSPLGSDLLIGKVEKKGKIIKNIKKIGTEKISPLIVAYCLYKSSTLINRLDFTITELYDSIFVGGPYKIFGISRGTLEEILRGLQEDRERILRVDLAADLDNIYLRDDLTPLDIVKIAAERL